MSVAWVGAGIAATGVVAGAVSSNKAANAQSKAAKDANKTQLYMFNQSRTDQAPFREAGYDGLDKLAFLLGMDPDGYQAGLAKSATAEERAAYNARMAKLKKDPLYGSLTKQFTGADLASEPGYKFGLSQGMNALTNSVTARGGALSGAAAKAAARFAQDYAGTKYNDAFNRDNINKTNTFNRLASLTGIGQTSATQIANQGIATGQSIAQNTIGAGNARASGYVGTANALTSGLSQGVNWYQGNQLLNSLNQQPSYGVAQQPGVTDWVSQG